MIRDACQAVVAGACFDKLQNSTVIRVIPAAIAVIVSLVLSMPAAAQRKKNKEPKELPTQQREAVADPPLSVTVETAKIGYLVSPLSAKGLLTQQTKDALKALGKTARGAQIVKLRAFVAGTGDLRRIPAIVSEEFSDRRQPIPAISVVQVGLLPLEGAQVLLEAVTQEKKPVNPNGLVFFSGQQVAPQGQVDNPMRPIGPELDKSIAGLKLAAGALGVEPAAMARVTCLVSSLANYPQLSQQLSQEFPQAVSTIVQLQRGPVRPVVECEAVGRLPQAPASAIVLENPKGLTASLNYSQVALVNAPRIVLTGAQSAFGSEDADVKLAFDRLGRVLEAAKTSYSQVFFANYYPLTNPVVDKIRALRFQYLDKSRPPASTLILFEGLPSLDASFAMEVAAAAN